MRFKTNLVISAVFAALLAFVYFYEIKGGEEREEAAKQARQLLDFSDHEATRIFIDRADAAISLARTPDGWRLQSPVMADADEKAVERYLRNLRETGIERVVEDSAAAAGNPGLAAKYGLDNPRLRVLIELSETVLDTVVLGADSPTERYAYARRGGENPEIFTVRAWRFDNLDKEVFDLRDRRVLVFDSDEVREIGLAGFAMEEELVIVRDDEGGWRLMPVDRPADESAVEELLQEISNSEAQAFVTETPGEEELANRGLAEPIIGVSLLLGEERAEKRLAIGLEAEGGQHYAFDPGRAPVFLVDSTLVQAVGRSAFDLRNKKPVAVEDRDAIGRVELWQGGEPAFTAERDTTGGWHISAPEDRDAKSWKLNTLLSDIDGIEVEEFTVDAAADADMDLVAYGLDVPAVRIELTDDLEAKVEIRVGEVDGVVYLMRTGVASVYRIGTDALEGLNLGLDDVSKAPVTSAEKDTASE